MLREKSRQLQWRAGAGRKKEREGETEMSKMHSDSQVHCDSNMDHSLVLSLGA